LVGPSLFLIGYGAVVVAPGAIVLWGVFRAAGRYRSEVAGWLGAVFWVAVMLPPVIGLAIDGIRSPVDCDPGVECNDYIVWWLALPVGWVLGAAVAASVIVFGRRRRS
jgi:hypothetical protein